MLTLRLRSRFLAAVPAAFFLALAGSANAACTRLGFSVNDYGKAGPAADAQKLLDNHIAGWTRKKGVRKYTTGKKTVECKLYLDVGLFDEYTCVATASVCWYDKPSARDAAAVDPGK